MSKTLAIDMPISHHQACIITVGLHDETRSGKDNQIYH